MKNNKSSSASGIGLPGVVFVVFLILKLTGVIRWSWWWVTSPLWIFLLLTILITAIYVLNMVYNYKR